MQQAPWAAVPAPLGVQRSGPEQEDVEQSHSPSLPGDPPVFAVPAAGFSIDLASAHLTCTLGPGFVSSGVGLTEVNVCDSSYQMKSAPTARPFFVERCLQLFLEGVSPTTALPPWHLPPSFAVVGRSSKHPDQQRAIIPGSGFQPVFAN